MMRVAFMMMLGMLAFKDCSKRDALLLDITEIRYTASTRGYFYQIKVSPMLMQVKMDRNSQDETIFQVEAEKWDELLGHVEAIDLRKLGSLKGETKMQAVDRAASASLRVITRERQYECPSFDHGNPPEEILPLIQAMLELAESVQGNED